MPSSPYYIYRRWYLKLAARLLDSLGMIYRAFTPRKPPFNAAKIRRILAIRLDHIGDVLMTRPALIALHRAFPEAQIDFLISRDIAPLFRNQSEIHNVVESQGHWFARKTSLPRMVREFYRLAMEIQSRDYDLVIDFRGDVRHNFLMALARVPERWGYGVTGGGFLLTRQGNYDRTMHQVGLNMNLIRELLPAFASTEGAPLTVTAAQTEEFWARFGREFVLSHDRPRILVHPSAAYPSKRWPAENFRELIKRLIENQSGQIILLGTEDEKSHFTAGDFAPGQLIDLRGCTRLEDLPVLYDACQLFIGNDSGPAHLAAAQGLPLVVIFSGTNRWEVWHPWSAKLHLVRHEVPCSPCESRECPLKHHDCMKLISLDEVYSAAVSALAGSPS